MIYRPGLYATPSSFITMDHTNPASISLSFFILTFISNKCEHKTIKSVIYYMLTWYMKVSLRVHYLQTNTHIAVSMATHYLHRRSYSYTIIQNNNHLNELNHASLHLPCTMAWTRTNVNRGLLTKVTISIHTTGAREAYSWHPDLQPESPSPPVSFRWRQLLEWPWVSASKYAIPWTKC